MSDQKELNLQLQNLKRVTQQRNSSTNFSTHSILNLKNHRFNDSSVQQLEVYQSQIFLEDRHSYATPGLKVPIIKQSSDDQVKNRSVELFNPFYKKSFKYVSEPSSPTQFTGSMRSSNSYNFLKYQEDKKRHKVSALRHSQFKMPKNSVDSTRSNDMSQLSPAMKQYNECDNPMNPNAFMSVASIDKIYFRNMQLSKQLQIELKEARYEIEQYKDVNKKLIEKLIKHEGNINRGINLDVKNAEPPNQKLLIQKAASPSNRRGTIQKLPYINQCFFTMAEQVGDVENQMRQSLCDENEDLLEIVSTLSKDLVNVKAYYDKRYNNIRQKYVKLKVVSKEVQRKFHDEFWKNEQLTQKLETLLEENTTIQKKLELTRNICEEQLAKLVELAENLDKTRNELNYYQRRYQDIDVDALHERCQELQTQNITLQFKNGTLKNRMTTLRRQSGIQPKKQSALQKLLSGSGIREDDDEDSLGEDYDFEDNNDRFAQEDTQDLEKMSEDKRVQMEYEKQQLKHSLALKGLNLNYELNLHPNHLLQIENQVFK